MPQAGGELLMGNVQKTLSVVAVVSDHNSGQDAEDEALWEDLVAAVDKVVTDPRWAEIRPMRFLG